MKMLRYSKAGDKLAVNPEAGRSGTDRVIVETNVDVDVADC